MSEKTNDEKNKRIMLDALERVRDPVLYEVVTQVRYKLPTVKEIGFRTAFDEFVENEESCVFLVGKAHAFIKKRAKQFDADFLDYFACLWQAVVATYANVPRPSEEEYRRASGYECIYCGEETCFNCFYCSRRLCGDHAYVVNVTNAAVAVDFETAVSENDYVLYSHTIACHACLNELKIPLRKDLKIKK